MLEQDVVLWLYIQKYNLTEEVALELIRSNYADFSGEGSSYIPDLIRKCRQDKRVKKKVARRESPEQRISSSDESN